MPRYRSTGPSLPRRTLDYLQHGAAEGTPVLALDAHGAGQHQRVLVSTDGAAARAQVGDPKSPLRNTIIAILDAASS